VFWELWAMSGAVVGNPSVRVGAAKLTTAAKSLRMRATEQRGAARAPGSGNSPREFGARFPPHWLLDGE